MFLFVVFIFFSVVQVIFFLQIIIRIIVIAVLVVIFFAPFHNFSCVIFFPFRFRYLQENALEVLPDEGFNGLSRLKIL